MNRNHFDIIFVTNQPSFYKVRQWNEIAKRKKVLLVFLEWMEKDRNKDFVSEKPGFDYEVLPEGKWEGVRYLTSLLRRIDYNRLIIGGWDDLRLRVLPFISNRRKNALLCESSFYEYRLSFFKDLIKKIILRRISVVYPSGLAQGRIFEFLGFKGEYRYTGGCGLLNYIEQPVYQPRTEVKTFLYVGRLVEVKNLKMLIRVFNELPHLQLNIIGFGEQEDVLKTMAKENIKFLGAVENKRLSEYYQQADVYVLPSTFEPWGLVIEEALNNGTPVIVSDKVGCRDDLVTEETGLVFDHDSEQSLLDAIVKMTNIDFHNHLRKHISTMDFKKRAQHQIDVFVETRQNNTICQNSFR